MDDWERRFIDKSRRRFESERRERRNRLIRTWIGGTVAVMLVAIGVAELASRQ